MLEGSTVTPISDEFAEYALNLAATNIVLLVGIYKKGGEVMFRSFAFYTGDHAKNRDN